MAEFLMCTGPIFGFDSSNEMQKLARARQGLARLQGNGFPQEHFILLQESNFPFCKKTPFYENCFFPLRDKHFFLQANIVGRSNLPFARICFPPLQKSAITMCDRNSIPNCNCDL